MLVIRVGGVQRHEAGHAVDVAADAGVDAVEGDVLGVGVHGLEFRRCRCLDTVVTTSKNRCLAPYANR